MERHVPGRTALLHYTDMHRQPWVSWGNPLGYLWVASLREAVAAGAITRDELTRQVTAGHVRPSLLAQLDRGLDDGMLLPAADRRRDAGFHAPFPPFRSTRMSWGLHRLLWMRALLRGRLEGAWLRHLRHRVRQIAPWGRV